MTRYVTNHVTYFCDRVTEFDHGVPVKIKVEISQSFVAFSKYMNFTIEEFPEGTLLLEVAVDVDPGLQL